jgi:RNA 3'-terminal phosphate cyclase (ATP)
LRRHGFYPAGGGEVHVNIQPVERLDSLHLVERGKLLLREVRGIVANLPVTIAERECQAIRAATGWNQREFLASTVDAVGPGNVVIIELAFQEVTELFIGFGQRGVPAEKVALSAVQELNDYLATDAPVGPHLADQLLLPMGLAAQQGRAGRFRTGELTEHSRTHIDVLQRFLDVQIDVQTDGDGTNLVSVSPRSAVN